MLNLNIKLKKRHVLGVICVCFFLTTTFFFMSTPYTFFTSKEKILNLFDSNFRLIDVDHRSLKDRRNNEKVYSDPIKQCLLNLMIPRDSNYEENEMKNNDHKKSKNNTVYSYSQRIAPAFYEGEWVYSPRQKANIFHYDLNHVYNIHEKSMFKKWNDMNVSKNIYSKIYNESTCYPSCFQWKINSDICKTIDTSLAKTELSEKKHEKEEWNIGGKAIPNNIRKRNKERKSGEKNFQNKKNLQKDQKQQKSTKDIPVFPLPFSPSIFCESLYALDIQHILLVGDSIQQQMAMSLVKMMKWKETNNRGFPRHITICESDVTEDKGGSTIASPPMSTGTSDLYSFNSSSSITFKNSSPKRSKSSKTGITISFVRNDFLYLENYRVVNHTCPWIYEGKCTRNMYHEFQNCGPWTHLLDETTTYNYYGVVSEIPPVDLLILNAGMHLHNLDVYRSMTKNLFPWLEKNFFKIYNNGNEDIFSQHQNIKKSSSKDKNGHKSHRRVIFRTSAPGHTDHSSRQKDAILGPTLYPFEYTGIFKQNFTWHLIGDFNDIVRTESRKVNQNLKEQKYFKEAKNVRKQGVTLLHADILLHNRADGHIDDLHYLLPSGFDWINIALYHHILAWRIEEELLDDESVH